MSGPTPRRLQRYVRRRLRLRAYLQSPGDGRQRPQIGAPILLWALLIGLILREWSFHALEALVRSPARQGLGVGRRFSEDTLAYFTERLDPEPMRAALAATVRRAKRNKAFDGTPWIGLALDGTAAGRCREAHCALCQPIRDEQGRVHGHLTGSVW